MLTGTLGPGVTYAFTDRHGGVSSPPYDSCNLSISSGDSRANVETNRAIVAERLAVERLLFLHQVHGADVAVADGPWPRGLPRADAAVTGRPGLAVAVLAADCAPVLLADPVAGIVAAAHVGRAGLVAGTVDAAVGRMEALGARPERIAAAIGPSVCGRCYEVPAALQTDVARRVPSARMRTRTGRPALDVAAGIAAQLAAAGVATVTRAGGCTMESPDHYSHRRERVTGRFAGIVWLSS